MSDDVRTLLREAAPDPSTSVDFDDMWVRGRWQRRVRPAVAAAAGAVAIAVAVVVLPNLLPGEKNSEIEVVDQPLLSASTSSSPQPSSSATSPTEGWQTVSVGGATFSVPQDFRIHDVIEEGDGLLCTSFGFEPIAFVAESEPRPISCPASGPNRTPSVAVFAAPASVAPSERPDGAERVTINGFEGWWWRTQSTEEWSFRGGEERHVEEVVIDHYVFSDLDFYLWIRSDPNPDLADQIVESIWRHGS